MKIRKVKESDYKYIISELDSWWGGRHMTPLLSYFYFKFFNNTSFIVETDNKIVAFIIGFISQSNYRDAYIHFLGVDPEYRNKGYGKLLHQKFLNTVKLLGCDSIHLVTSTVNKNSVAFHTHIGFVIVLGDYIQDGISIHKDYDGQNEDRVVFIKKI